MVNKKKTKNRLYIAGGYVTETQWSSLTKRKDVKKSIKSGDLSCKNRSFNYKYN